MADRQRLICSHCREDLGGQTVPGPGGVLCAPLHANPRQARGFCSGSNRPVWLQLIPD